MKGIYFWPLLLFVLLEATYLQAQEQTQLVLENKQEKNQLKTNLLGHFGGQYQLSYERFLLQKRFSLQCSAGFFKQKVIRSGNTDDGQISYKSDALGWLLQPEIRYYLLSKIKFLNHSYLATSFRYRKGKTKIADISRPMDMDMSAKAHNITKSTALVFGYQRIIKKYVCLETFGGLQYRMRNSKKTFHSNSISETQFDEKFASIESQTLDITGANWNNENKFLPYLGLNLGILF